VHKTRLALKMLYSTHRMNFYDLHASQNKCTFLSKPARKQQGTGGPKQALTH